MISQQKKKGYVQLSRGRIRGRTHMITELWRLWHNAARKEGEILCSTTRRLVLFPDSQTVERSMHFPQLKLQRLNGVDVKGQKSGKCTEAEGFDSEGCRCVGNLVSECRTDRPHGSL